MKKDHIENMSRRVFLAKSGKLIGLGILAHFSILGKLSADDIKNDKIRRKGDACKTVARTAINAQPVTPTHVHPASYA